MVISSAMSFDSGVTRSRMKAVKQLRQTNTQQLEAETKKMENRIRSLKEQMVREKEEREKSGGIRWMSGCSGPLNKPSHHATKKKSTKSDKQNPRKIKLLTDAPLSLYAKKPPQDAVREGGGGRGTAQSACGQCDKYKATLGCVECGENYCVSCFTNFHQKGALKKHSTRPVNQDKAGIQEEKKQPAPPSVPRTNKSSAERASRVDRRLQDRQDNGNSTQREGGALLYGTFDEDESAASFADVLKEWRSAKQKKDDHVWVNPADTSKGTSCGTTTASQAPKTVEIKLNFGPNKSLNYLDRLLLKKNREKPAKFHNRREPTNVTSKKRESSGSKDETSRAQDEFRLNYREIFQSLGNQSESAKTTRQSTSRCDAETIIEELTDDCVNIEETGACVVQEKDDQLRTVPLLDRPSSRSGRVSVMAMTSTGSFEEEMHSLVLEDLSGLSNSPVWESTAQTKDNEAFNRARSQPHRGSHIKQYVAETRRVWSPCSSYTGLSDFFLAGVKTPSPSKQNIPREKLLEARLRSKPLLCRSVWKPQESVCITEVESRDEGGESGGSPRGGEQSAVVPPVEEPVVDTERTPNVSISYSSDHELDDSLQTNLELSDPVNSPRIHDFGIVDFLKAAPEPSKEDYNAIHRVSTVTPLSLTPKPPQLLWSDEDNDDDVKALLSAHTPEDFDETDQDEDDRATLDELAWELASTTGRLTECDDMEDVERCEGEDSWDEDSIEENDRGSGLSSPDELNADSEDRTACELNGLDDENVQYEVRALR